MDGFSQLRKSSPEDLDQGGEEMNEKVRVIVAALGVAAIAGGIGTLLAASQFLGHYMIQDLVLQEIIGGFLLIGLGSLGLYVTIYTLKKSS